MNRHDKEFNFMRLVLCCLVLLLQSACGGSGGPSVQTVLVNPSTVSNAGLEFTVTRDTATGIITFDPDPSTTASLTFSPNNAFDFGGFQGLTAESGSARYLRRSSENGVVAIIMSDPSITEGFTGSVAARTTEATIPIEGSADFSGDYVGLLEGDGLTSFGDAVAGEVDIKIDFGTGVLDGAITQRTTNMGSQMADVNFFGGFFVAPGNVSASLESDARPSSSAVGATSIFLTGNSSEELVGNTQIQHTLSSPHPLGDRSLREFGGFIASRN